MCLIIYSPPNYRLHYERLVNCSISNPHGFGMTVPNGKGELEYFKTLTPDIFDVLDLYEKYRDKPVALHFRFRTRGQVIEENVQPIKILVKKFHGQDLAFFHNGTIKNMVPAKSKYSDSYHFAKDYLKPVLRTNPELIDSLPFQDLIAKMIWPSRGLLMKGDGSVIFLNRNKGYNIGVSWISNIYSILSPFSKRFRNPPTKEEIKAEKEELKEEGRKIRRRAELTRYHSSLKYDPDFDWYYKIEPKTGERVYVPDYPEFAIEKL